MAQQLSLAARPKSLDQLVGQDRIVSAIRGHKASGRVVKAWLFSGSKGTGKTTISKILALSYMCTHQTVFGTPCIECRKNRSSFDIVPIPAAKLTGKDEIEKKLEGAEYSPMGAGAYRVYILDEVHMLSRSAQSLLLDYLEESPATTIFILCTTDPQKLLETVRSRCVCYELKDLQEDDIEILVARLLKSIKSKLPSDRLVQELVDKHVHSSRLIAQAVEKYASGQTPEEAAQVEGSTAVDINALTRSMIKGDWVGVSNALLAESMTDLRPVRIQVVAYLRSILLRDKEISDRTKTVADAITALTNLSGNAEDSVVAGAMAAELYRVTSMFKGYAR